MTEETITNPVRPLRWIDTSQINAGFDGNFAGKQIFDYQNKRCYFQKWQSSDKIVDQLLLDYVPSEVNFINIATGSIALTANYTEIPTAIIGRTFKVYELEVILAGLPVGQYVIQWSYEDVDGLIHPIESEPIDVQVKWANTMLLRYKNSENDKDVIFDTGIQFQFRVESAISDFDPRNNRVVYNDYNTNATQLSASPYRKFTFYLGYQYGVPNWVYDKMNWIQSLDQIYYDGINYQIMEGAEYETNRNPDNGFIGATIDVQSVVNNFNKYQTQPNTDNEFIPMQKILNYNGNTDNLVIAGKFKYQSNLEKICIRKYTPSPFTLLVGTTLGGAEIATFVVDDDTNVLTIEELFATTTTLYLGGLNGATCDVDIVYKQLDEPPIPNPMVPGEIAGIQANTAAVYVEIQPGDLAIHWDTATGLGRPNTKYFNCAWMDGRNGTQNWSDETPYMMNEENPDRDLSKLGVSIGSDTLTIAKANLPAEGIGLNVKVSTSGEWRTGSGSGRPVMAVGGSSEYGPTMGAGYGGNTANMGSGTPLTNQPKGVIALWYCKLND